MYVSGAEFRFGARFGDQYGGIIYSGKGRKKGIFKKLTDSI